MGVAKRSLLSNLAVSHRGSFAHCGPPQQFISPQSYLTTSIYGSSQTPSQKRSSTASSIALPLTPDHTKNTTQTTSLSRPANPLFTCSPVNPPFPVSWSLSRIWPQYSMLRCEGKGGILSDSLVVWWSGTNGMSPGRNDMSPGRNDMSPGRNGISPGRNGMSPDADGMSPGTNGIRPRRNGIRPGANGIRPRTNGMSPGTNGISPGTNGMSPRANGISLGTNGMSPRRNGMSPGNDI